MNLSRIPPMMPFLVAGCTSNNNQHSKEITDVTFEEEVSKSKLPVLVDFWAPWCPPCRAISPEVERIAKQYSGKLKVVKLNIDENQEVTTKLEIKHLPTLMFFKEGRKVSDLTGFYKKEEIVPFVEEIINPKK